MASNAKVFEITVPQKDGLCCAICKIVNSENDPMAYSNFCSNKLKCRQFLQETPQAMAAPITNRRILEIGGSVYVIVARDLLESCTFQDHCDALNVQVTDLLDPIPTYVYKACLLHTVECRLTPQWNRVGLYLVEGRDFLSSTGSVNAITLDIKEIHGNSARLHVEAVNIKIPFVRLNTARPLQHDIQPPVRVLPSMKMANVLCISKRIDEKFKDYEHLRAYWKDMHGYMLPDYEEGLLFYNLEFFYFKSNSFLYPETCLASGPLKILPPPVDPVPIIYKFVGELRGRVPKLCGQQLDVCPTNTYQAAVLACTPMLSRTTGRFPASYDTGYGTQSRRIRTPSFRTPDTCEIPTKRTRLSLSRTNDDFLMRESDEFDDFDCGISPTCSTSKFPRSRNTGDASAMAFDVDSEICLAGIVQKDENRSCYFEEEEERSQGKSLTEPTDKEDKPKKLSLKEKLLKGRGNE